MNAAAARDQQARAGALAVEQREAQQPGPNAAGDRHLDPEHHTPRKPGES